MYSVELMFLLNIYESSDDDNGKSNCPKKGIQRKLEE